MPSPVPITKEQARAAVEADGREIIHSQARTGQMVLGADTSKESLLAAIDSADDSDPEHPQIGWTQDLFGHELIVIDGRDAVRWYDLTAPPDTFTEGDPDVPNR
jgi:hypothetical protein